MQDTKQSLNQSDERPLINPPPLTDVRYHENSPDELIQIDNEIQKKRIRREKRRK